MKWVNLFFCFTLMTCSNRKISRELGVNGWDETQIEQFPFQNQLAQLAQLARSNPMMAAAMMSGGLMGGQAQAQAQAAAAAAAVSAAILF